MKKYLGYALLAFVIFYLLESPGGAAHVVRATLSDLRQAGNDLSQFVNNLGA